MMYIILCDDDYDDVYDGDGDVYDVNGGDACGDSLYFAILLHLLRYLQIWNDGVDDYAFFFLIFFNCRGSNDPKDLWPSFVDQRFFHLFFSYHYY